jgi:protein MpaA
MKLRLRAGKSFHMGLQASDGRKRNRWHENFKQTVGPAGVARVEEIIHPSTMSVEIDWPGYHRAFGEAAGEAGFSATLLVDLEAGPVFAWDRAGPGRRVYLSAGIHGDEPAGPLAFLELMRSGFFDLASHWSICPTLNPSGLRAGTRENACGIDLNRDYWLRGSAEVLAHTAWFERRPTPNLFISLHEDWETTGFYFYEINLGEDRPERARGILDAVRPWFPPEGGLEIDGHEVREAGWIYHQAEADVPDGWPEAIYLAKRGCQVSFTFETPSQAVLRKRVEAHAAAVRAACGWLFQEVV